MYIAQFKLPSYLDCYVCISRNLSCFLIWIDTFVSPQFKLCSYLDRYVCISYYFIWIVTFVSCAILVVFLIWIITFVSCAIVAVFLFGLLRLYLAQFKLFSYLDCDVCISQFKLFSYLDCYVCTLRNFSCFVIWIVTFVSRAI